MQSKFILVFSMSKELYFCSFRSSDWLVVEFPRAPLGKLGKCHMAPAGAKERSEIPTTWEQTE